MIKIRMQNWSPEVQVTEEAGDTISSLSLHSPDIFSSHNQPVWPLLSNIPGNTIWWRTACPAAVKWIGWPNFPCCINIDLMLQQYSTLASSGPMFSKHSTQSYFKLLCAVCVLIFWWVFLHWQANFGPLDKFTSGKPFFFPAVSFWLNIWI